MTTLNLLEKLASLSAQRTVRTDRLHAAVANLLECLKAHVEVGESVTIDGHHLRLCRVRSNVGHAVMWDFDGVDPCEAVNSAGYLHGDFNCPWRGPRRDNLIDLAKRASCFVAAFVAKQQRELDVLETAEVACKAAASQLAEGKVQP